MKKQIPLSGWTRSLCKSAEYPAFDEPEPVTLPDPLGERMPDFLGYACYETTFVLDRPKPLLLEISDAARGVEVFMNGDTKRLKHSPPYRYDLSDLAQQGKNYLAIEVAIIPESERPAATEPSMEKTQHSKSKIRCGITGSVKLYTT